MRGAVVDEPERFLAFFAGIGKGDVDVAGQRAIERAQNLVQHVSRRAASAEGNQRRTLDEIRVQHLVGFIVCVRQPDKHVS